MMINLAHETDKWVQETLTGEIYFIDLNVLDDGQYVSFIIKRVPPFLVQYQAFRDK